MIQRCWLQFERLYDPKEVEQSYFDTQEDDDDHVDGYHDGEGGDDVLPEDIGLGVIPVVQAMAEDGVLFTDKGGFCDRCEDMLAEEPFTIHDLQESEIERRTKVYEGRKDEIKRFCVLERRTLESPRPSKNRTGQWRPEGKVGSEWRRVTMTMIQRVLGDKYLSKVVLPLCESWYRMFGAFAGSKEAETIDTHQFRQGLSTCCTPRIAIIDNAEMLERLVKAMQAAEIKLETGKKIRDLAGQAKQLLKSHPTALRHISAVQVEKHNDKRKGGKKHSMVKLVGRIENGQFVGSLESELLKSVEHIECHSLADRQLRDISYNKLRLCCLELRCASQAAKNVERQRTKSAGTVTSPLLDSHDAFRAKLGGILDAINQTMAESNKMYPDTAEAMAGPYFKSMLRRFILQKRVSLLARLGRQGGPRAMFMLVQLQAHVRGNLVRLRLRHETAALSNAPVAEQTARPAVKIHIKDWMEVLITFAAHLYDRRCIQYKAATRRLVGIHGLSGELGPGVKDVTSAEFRREHTSLAISAMAYTDEKLVLKSSDDRVFFPELLLSGSLFNHKLAILTNTMNNWRTLVMLLDTSDTGSLIPLELRYAIMAMSEMGIISEQRDLNPMDGSYERWHERVTIDLDGVADKLTDTDFAEAKKLSGYQQGDPWYDRCHEDNAAVEARVKEAGAILNKGGLLLPTDELLKKYTKQAEKREAREERKRSGSGRSHNSSNDYRLSEYRFPRMNISYPTQGFAETLLDGLTDGMDLLEDFSGIQILGRSDELPNYPITIGGKNQPRVIILGDQPVPLERSRQHGTGWSAWAIRIEFQFKIEALNLARDNSHKNLATAGDMTGSVDDYSVLFSSYRNNSIVAKRYPRLSVQQALIDLIVDTAGYIVRTRTADGWLYRRTYDTIKGQLRIGTGAEKKYQARLRDGVLHLVNDHQRKLIRLANCKPGYPADSDRAKNLGSKSKLIVKTGAKNIVIELHANRRKRATGKQHVDHVHELRTLSDADAETALHNANEDDDAWDKPDDWLRKLQPFDKDFNFWWDRGKLSRKLKEEFLPGSEEGAAKSDTTKLEALARTFLHHAWHSEEHDEEQQKHIDEAIKDAKTSADRMQLFYVRKDVFEDALTLQDRLDACTEINENAITGKFIVQENSWYAIQIQGERRASSDGKLGGGDDDRHPESYNGRPSGGGGIREEAETSLRLMTRIDHCTEEYRKDLLNNKRQPVPTYCYQWVGQVDLKDVYSLGNVYDNLCSQSLDRVGWSNGPIRGFMIFGIKRGWLVAHDDVFEPRAKVYKKGRWEPNPLTELSATDKAHRKVWSKYVAAEKRGKNAKRMQRDTTR